MSLMAHNLLNCAHLAVELEHVSMKLRISSFAYDAYSYMYLIRNYRKSLYCTTWLISLILVKCQIINHRSEGVFLLWHIHMSVSALLLPSTLFHLFYLKTSVLRRLFRKRQHALNESPILSISSNQCTIFPSRIKTNQKQYLTHYL